MQASDKCVQTLCCMESFRARFYLCSGKAKTIGYGHVLEKGEKIKEPLSRADAVTLLKYDLCEAEMHVSRLIDVDLKQCEFDALVSFVFNIGGGAFERSTLRRRLNAGLRKGIPYQFRRWKKSCGRIVFGLQVRREVEVAMFEGRLNAIPTKDIRGNIEKIRRNLKKSRRRR